MEAAIALPGASPAAATIAGDKPDVIPFELLSADCSIVSASPAVFIGGPGIGGSPTQVRRSSFLIPTSSFPRWVWFSDPSSPIGEENLLT
jgi:hypothetical protein